MKTNAFDILQERGFLYQCTDAEGLRKLFEEGPTTFYVGFDPTGDSLHVGHLLPVMAMRHLQKAGHRPLALVGGATGLVGDPSGKSEARPILSRERVAHNVACLKAQISRFISMDGATFVNNADWFEGMLYLDFLRDIGSKFSVNRMLAAESVKMRLETGLSFLEFNYMCLQAYDYLVLSRKYGCRLQIGGQDQWGNITCGTELIRRLDQKEVYGFTMPLLMNSNGQKFGKSVGGAVYLDPAKTPIFDYYQFWRNVDDADVKKLMGYFSSLPMDEIGRLCETNVNRAKEILAYEATALAHGVEAAEKSFCAAGAKFGFADPENKIPTSSAVARVDVAAAKAAAIADLPTVELSIPEEGIDAVSLFVQAGLCKSNGEARRLIQGGGAYCGEERVSDFAKRILPSDFRDGALLIKAGKKNVKRVVRA